MSATVASPAKVTTPGPKKRKKLHSTLEAGTGTYLLVILVAIVSIFPLYYTIVMASHTNAEMAAKRPPILPNTSIFSNIHKALEIAPLNKGLINSVIVAGLITLGTVALCTLAGFAFAKLQFKGRNALLGICIGTMMVPTQMGVIPLYMLMAKLGLAGHLSAVILPGLCTAFGVFFMRQYVASAVPDDLIEAAYMDGAGPFRVFWSLVLPMSRPILGVVSVFAVIASWKDFLWPMLVLRDQNLQPLAVRLPALQASTDLGVLMAAMAIAALLPVVLFLLFQRMFLHGAGMGGAVKG